MRAGVGELLADSGALTFDGLRRASEWQKLHGGTIERALLLSGAVSEEALTEALSKASGLPAVHRDRLLLATPDVVGALPREARRRLRALPFERVAGVLHVAICDPENPILETGLTATAGSDVKLWASAEPVLDEFLGKWDRYEDAEEPPLEIELDLDAADDEDDVEVVIEGEEAPAPLPPKTPFPFAAVPSPELLAPFGDLPPATPPRGGRSPIEALAHALLSSAVRGEALELELGADARGAFAKTHHASCPSMTRRLPRNTLGPLAEWFRARGKKQTGDEIAEFFVAAGGPDASERLRVELRQDGPTHLHLTLRRPEPRPPSSMRLRRRAACRHEGAEGEVFCPKCGKVL